MPRRVPYDASRAALYRPGEALNFFQIGPIATPAALCAEMARLSYVQDPMVLQGYLPRTRFTIVRHLDKGSTQGFLAKGTFGGQLVLVAAFRGTEPGDPTDLFSDARIVPSAWEKGGRVHGGFAKAFDLVRDEFLEGTEDAHASLLLTGHSLGAALATLASSLRPEGRLFTFGSPRVGDPDFQRATSRITHERYVNCCDMVTRVPPEALGYVHTGTLRFLDASGTVQDWDGNQVEAERQRASLQYLHELGFLHGTVPVRELSDHAPVNYVSAVP
jgi:hypothetical protein